jgi:hypothetical protein
MEYACVVWSCENTHEAKAESKREPNIQTLIWKKQQINFAYILQRNASKIQQISSTATSIKTI